MHTIQYISIQYIISIQAYNIFEIHRAWRTGSFQSRTPNPTWCRHLTPYKWLYQSKVWLYQNKGSNIEIQKKSDTLNERTVGITRHSIYERAQCEHNSVSFDCEVSVLVAEWWYRNVARVHKCGGWPARCATSKQFIPFTRMRASVCFICISRSKLIPNLYIFIYIYPVPYRAPTDNSMSGNANPIHWLLAARSAATTTTPAERRSRCTHTHEHICTFRERTRFLCIEF